MKNINRFATPLIAVALMTVPVVGLAQSSFLSTENGTATSSSPVQNKAYNDGFNSAKIDATAKRALDPQKSYMFVHPPVKKGEADAYRSSFTSGYEAQMKQQQN